MNPQARRYTYLEYPQHYAWKSASNKWMQRQKGYAIGRIYFVSPSAGETFYLRLLLTVDKGSRSYEHLKTFDGVERNSYKEVCRLRGLIEDGGEWVQCLRDATIMKTGYQLRRLFCIILTECHPLNPLELWNEFADDICDDLAHKIHVLFHIPNPTRDQITDYGLQLVDDMLFESGKNLKDFPPMPEPTGDWRPVQDNPLMWEQMQYQFEEVSARNEDNVVHLNAEQRDAYETVVHSVFNNLGKLFFLNGPAGTGKTFVYNTIAATVRSKNNNIVIMVASSGIAALLLVGGRIAHSTLKLPIDIHENSICGISKHSPRGKLFKEVKLIIWDEVPMQYKHCVEALDRTL